MGLFTTTYLIGSTSVIEQQEADEFMESFEALVLDIDALGIFSHNLMIALTMFIPGFGVLWGLLSAWSTGYAFAAITMIHLEAATIHPLAILFLSPFGLMEITSYSIGISKSFILIVAIIKKTDLKKLIKPTLIEVGIVVALLAAGAYIEFYLINLATSTPEL